MASCSTYLAQAIINHTLRGQAYTPPAGVYLALAVADITAANVTTNEVSGAWYGRKQITSWVAPTTLSTSNSNALEFNRVTGSAVSIPYWGLYDASTSGNLLAYGAFDTARVANLDNVVKVAANALTLAFSGMFTQHLAQAIINHFLRGVPYTPPSRYLALYAADPTTGGAEISYTGYARQSVSTWDAPTGNATQNTSGFSFPIVAGADVTATHWGIVDAASSGNLLYAKQFVDGGGNPTSQVMNVGDVFAGDPGDLTISIE